MLELSINCFYEWWAEDKKKNFIIEVIKAVQEKVWWIIACMDDRLWISWSTIRIAGSWVFLLKELWEEKFAILLRKLWVKTITVHNDCWAAKAYCETFWIKWDPDKIVEKILWDFARKNNFSFKFVDIKSEHNTNMIIVDTTWRFDQKEFAWPETFVVTARKFNKEESRLDKETINVYDNHVLWQIETAFDIACSDHNEEINQQNKDHL